LNIVGHIKDNNESHIIYLDDGGNFYLDGTNLLSKSIIEELNKKKLIIWEQSFQSKEISAFNYDNANNWDLNVNEQDFIKKDPYTVVRDDYDYMMNNPDHIWRDYIIGLYLLKNNQNLEALGFLENAYKSNPLEIHILKYINIAKNQKNEDHHVLPNRLPDTMPEITISQKYLIDFMNFDLSQFSINIKNIQIINFALTAATITMLMVAIVSIFAKSLS